MKDCEESLWRMFCQSSSGNITISSPDSSQFSRASGGYHTSHTSVMNAQDKRERRERMSARRTKSLSNDKLEESEEAEERPRIVWSRSNEEHSTDIEENE